MGHTYDLCRHCSGHGCKACAGRGHKTTFDRAPGPWSVLAVWLAVMVALLWFVAAASGCETGRQFTRSELTHYASEDEVYVSAAVLSVGKYLTLIEDEVEAEVYTGTYYDLEGDLPYGLVGAGLTWYAPDDRATVSLTGEGYAPEDGGALEHYGSVSVEVPWP